jgi:hypothetical protein
MAPTIAPLCAPERAGARGGACRQPLSPDPCRIGHGERWRRRGRITAPAPHVTWSRVSGPDRAARGATRSSRAGGPGLPLRLVGVQPLLEDFAELAPQAAHDLVVDPEVADRLVGAGPFSLAFLPADLLLPASLPQPGSAPGARRVSEMRTASPCAETSGSAGTAPAAGSCPGCARPGAARARDRRRAAASPAWCWSRSRAVGSVEGTHCRPAGALASPSLPTTTAAENAWRVATSALAWPGQTGNGG